MVQNKNLEEIQVSIGANLDETIERLLEDKNKGIHTYCIFNDHALYSDTITVDSAYIEVLGCTREELEREILENKKRRMIEIKKAKKDVPNQIKKGEELIYSFRHTDWEQTVKAIAISVYRGLITEHALDIMEAIEEEMPVDEIVKIFDKQGHSGWSASLTRNIVMMYSKNGYPFYKATHYGNWTIEEYDSILKIMRENEEANDTSIGAINSKQEVMNKQKRLIRQKVNKSNI